MAENPLVTNMTGDDIEINILCIRPWLIHLQAAWMLANCTLWALQNIHNIPLHLSLITNDSLSYTREVYEKLSFKPFCRANVEQLSCTLITIMVTAKSYGANKNKWFQDSNQLNHRHTQKDRTQKCTIPWEAEKNSSYL